MTHYKTFSHSVPHVQYPIKHFPPISIGRYWHATCACTNVRTYIKTQQVRRYRVHDKHSRRAETQVPIGPICKQSAANMLTSNTFLGSEDYSFIRFTRICTFTWYWQNILTKRMKSQLNILIKTMQIYRAYSTSSEFSMVFRTLDAK